MSNSLLPVLSVRKESLLPKIEIVAHNHAIVTLDGVPVHVRRLLASGDTNTKTRKNSGYGYQTTMLSMSAATIGAAYGLSDVCASKSPACMAGCLNHCGMANVFRSIPRARLAKKILIQAKPQWALELLDRELTQNEKRAEKLGDRHACRPNGFSDIRWEDTGIIDDHPNTYFYDYTKHADRAGAIRSNYWVTFSRSELNESVAIGHLQDRKNVAVVFHEQGAFTGNRAGAQRLPKTWNGFRVFDGSKFDLRFLDPRARKLGGYVVGLVLRAPTTAQRQRVIDSGFSVDVDSDCCR